MNVAIAREAFESGDARRLVGELDAELSAIYKPEQRFGPDLRPEHVASGLGTFLVARIDGEAVGCGALRRLDAGSAEVKRMYVQPAARGRGLAMEVLARLESAAREMGVTRLVLETGVHQGAAIALYTRAGFRPVPCWGEYARSATSICFEKRIQPGPS